MTKYLDRVTNFSELTLTLMPVQHSAHLDCGSLTEKTISTFKNTALSSQTECVETIFANTPGMAFQFRLQRDTGKFLFTHVSEGSVPLLGLRPDEIHQNWNVFNQQVLEQDREIFYSSLYQSSISMQAWNWEGRMRTISGQEKWINCRATPRFSSTNNVIWEGVMLNITEGKKTEQALIESGHLLRKLSAYTEQIREDERRRVAREVHDELGQALSALRMELAMLGLHFAQQDGPITQKFKSMTQRVDHTIKITRHITSSLRPVALDLGLVAGLEWLVEEFVNHAGIKCQLHSNGCDETLVADNSATALFRIVQESLSNVAKHAQASEAEVSIMVEDNQSVLIEIVDNGKGFLANIAKAGSFGLIGMSERAMMLGGRLNIDSSPDKGTCVKVKIPLKQP